MTLTALILLFVSNNLMFSIGVENNDKTRVDKKIGNFTAEKTFNERKYNERVDRYTWIGDHWMPQNGVQHFSPKDIRHLFQKENTLWLGDSTARQEYFTMYNMWNAKDVQNIPMQDLNRHIDKHKMEEGIFYDYARIKHCPDRIKEAEYFSYSGQVTGSNCSKSFLSPSISGSGKFDLIELHCLKEIFPRLQNHTSLSRLNYSVIILSMGIWEVVRAGNCKTNETPQLILMRVLDTLKDLSSSSLYIIWKTHGPSGAEENTKGQKTLELIETAQNWFSMHKPLHMGLSDFGFEIYNSSRSFGINRIKGDLQPHWGLQARTLSIQMVTNLVYMQDK